MDLQNNFCAFLLLFWFGFPLHFLFIGFLYYLGHSVLSSPSILFASESLLCVIIILTVLFVHSVIKSFIHLCPANVIIDIKVFLLSIKSMLKDKIYTNTYTHTHVQLEFELEWDENCLLEWRFFNI